MFFLKSASSLSLSLSLWLQAAAVLSCNSWEVLPPVQRHEDGPLSTGTPLGVGQTQR